MATVAVPKEQANHRAEEDAAWVEVDATLTTARLRWKRILGRVHVQCSWPLVVAYVHSGGQTTAGWVVYQAGGTTQPGDASSRGAPH